MSNNLVANIKLDEAIHFSLALGAGLIYSIIFNNFWLILPALIVGFLVDLDHFFDYFKYFGRSGFKNLKNFSKVESYLDPQGKIYVPLHGFEYTIIFWLLGHLIGVNGLSWAMASSYLFHICWDSFTLKYHHPLAYFFTYRAIKGFDISLFHYYK